MTKKFKKIKLLKTLTLLGTLGVVVTTPIIITSCSSNSNNTESGGIEGPGSGDSGEDTSKPQENIKPELKKTYKINGGLTTIGGKTGNKSEIQKNLNEIVNDDKSIVVKNFNNIPEEEQKKLEISLEVTAGNDDKWGKQNFKTWSTGIEESNKKNWNGSKSTINQNEKISINSKEELKMFISENIVQISKNTGISVDNNTIKLADVELSIDDEQNKILIGLELSNQMELYSFKNAIIENNNKYILQIPDNNIDLNIPANITAKNGNQKTTGKISFQYSIQHIIEEKKLELSDIQLPQKNGDELYKKITNDDIINQLKWNKEEISTKDEDILEEDSDFITFDKLNKQKVISDLGLTKNEDLLAIKITMEQRNPSENNFNGEYKIEAEVMNKNNSDSLSFKTYKYYKNIEEKEKTKSYTPFQLQVPNAYILDTVTSESLELDEPQAETDPNIYRYIDQSFITTPFVMGSKNVTSKSNNIEETQQTKAIKQNLQQEKTFKRFIDTIEKQQKTLNKMIFNGITFTFEDAKKHNAMTNGFKTVISLNIQLKKGFYFKNSFTKNENKYNTQDRNSKVLFGINYTTDSNPAAIKLDSTKTPEDVNNNEK